MTLKYDISTMSFEGYTIKKEIVMYQSNGFNFGVPKEIEFESMWCKKCRRECPTRRTIEGKAFQGSCEKCNMDYFVRGVWGQNEKM